MYPIPPTETLIETKTCRHCSASFPITDKDLEFYEKVSPVFPLNRHSEFVSESSAFPNNKEDPGSSPGWRNVKIEWDKIRYLIPTPTLCPDCRQQRRLSFRNERKLYKRNCDATGKSIISIYSPDKPFKVYHQDYWWSDKWDPIEYGREFDFNKGFFEQFGELLGEVPRLALNVDKSCENCDYANQITRCKDSYLVIWCADSEKCFYGRRVNNSFSCVDCTFCTEGTDCYGCIDIFRCSRCSYVFHSIWCSDSSYLDGCNGCEQCFLCTNLTNQKYHILNKACSPSEYERLISEYKNKTYAELDDIFSSLRSESIKKYSQNNQVENSYWDALSNTKDVCCVFDGSDLDAVKYSSFVQDVENTYDTDNSCCNSQWSYEISTGGVDMYRCAFSVDVWPSVVDIFYSDTCSYASSLFWCIGLRNKSYCILNKQYTREEYEALVPRIIEHMMNTPLTRGEAPKGQGGSEWGEFFPSSLSPFGYNETAVMEYYPLTRDQVSEDSNQNGKNIFNWSDYEAPFPRVEKIIPADKLPDDIASIPDDILNWAIECEITKKPFRIIKQELEFYKKHNLPIPRRHPDQRHLDRMALRNPRKLFERKCDKCGVEMITTYSPERKERVYCWACYDMEVLW